MALPWRFAFLVLGLLTPVAVPRTRADPYADYIRHSEDFRRVSQDPAWALHAWPSWTYMPWTFRWTIGYNEAAGRWSVAHGYNGAFVDRGNIATADSPTGRLDWINQFHLRFYADHTAGKGQLHLWDGSELKTHLAELHGTGVRPVPLDASTEAQLRAVIRKNISAVQRSPYRAAYALDDEVSWGHFVHPTMWRVTADPAAYSRWLTEIYGPDAAPRRDRWFTYDDIREKLARWSIAEFDASPLMDQWTFNDSVWCNLLGRLVTYANTIDPATPCGIVGGQMPSPFGGYDYAKLMRKVQFLESYNLGSSQAIIRSFNPQNALPAVTTHFHRSVDDTIWQTWYYLAHGNRGFIGWVDKWFDGPQPAPWHEAVAPTLREAANRIGPLMTGARWLHDGVAIYYNHASIQLGWILDAESHGRTWINRNADERLSSAGLVRHAWENMLRDSGLQYDFLSYADVLETGIPSDYRVLVLPACLCLSDAEGQRIREFCTRGGTVIADYLPGVWDQHGHGRPEGGALDDMFGVKHDPRWHAADIFGDRLWTETDQDANYSYKSYEELLTNRNTSRKDPSGFDIAARTLPVGSEHSFGQGRAVLMNLSPQWYNAYRVAGAEPARRREVFMAPIRAAGVAPRVRLAGDGDAQHGYEITYWRLANGRNLLFVGLNPEIRGTSLGGGNAVALKAATLPVSLEFAHEVSDVRDERTGRSLGTGHSFGVTWKQTEAVVLSWLSN